MVIGGGGCDGDAKEGGPQGKLPGAETLPAFLLKA